MTVTSVPFPPQEPFLTQPGYLLWTENGRDRWTALPAAQSFQESVPDSEFLSLIRSDSRGHATAGSPSSMSPSTQLVQLIGQLVVRGSGFLTPTNNDLLLDGDITIRRQAQQSGEPFPEDELAISRDGRAILRLRMNQGEGKLLWTNLEGLPKELERGLPPGEYQLRAVQSGASTRFQVAQPQVSQRIREDSQKLLDLLEESHSPLYLQFYAEALLTHRDVHGNPRPLRSEAYDLLDESTPEGPSTAYLRRLHTDIRDRLEGKQAKSVVVIDPTGIQNIDEARRAIADGKWNVAWKLLESAVSASDVRTQSLARLYGAVILAESSQATGDAAEALFLTAIAGLEGGLPADRLRAHNNYATFLHNRAQDRVYNHAFQAAAGVNSPLVSALRDWHAAREHLKQALAAAEQVEPAAAAAVQVNLSRLYSTLADLLRVIETASAEPATESELREAAESSSARLARLALEHDSSAEPMISGVAHEILAHLAFRRGDESICIEHADQALERYLDAGSLAGCESIYRLRGLVHYQARDQTNRASATSLALDDLLISQTIAEFLREQIPSDRIGLGRAGFLARRAYVHEKIIELLIEQGRPSEALGFAELAKARSLQDVLAGKAAGSSPERAIRDLDDVLADWPAEVAALEYFLGSERAYLFVVNPAGKVTAFQLLDEEGDPLASRELVEKVTRFLIGMELQARKLHQGLLSGRGFDPLWQDELHAFFQQLLPPGALDEIRSAQTLILVPHHVLHYFPFAALVTQPDTSQRGKMEMPQPRFLLDEPFVTCSAPSLGVWDLLRSSGGEPMRDVNVLGIAEFEAASALPGVEQDLQNVREIFGASVRQEATKREAHEANAKKLLKQPGVLFIATHGQNMAERPLTSYLLCHADEENDGRLTAAEIFSDEVTAGLIVMSACYSGLADRSPLPGDDLFGLQRAFLHAGSQTVVAGLWDVYDGTGPILMRSFFEKLAAGRPVAESLAQAQRQFVSDRREAGPKDPWMHPYFWAVYTVAGNDRLGFESTNANSVNNAERETDAASITSDSEEKSAQK